MRSSHEAPQNQDIADFLSQFPEKTDLEMLKSCKASGLCLEHKVLLA